MLILSPVRIQLGWRCACLTTNILDNLFNDNHHQDVLGALLIGKSSRKCGQYSLKLLLTIINCQLQCYAQSENPTECRSQSNDYLECLHHPKEVRSTVVQAFFLIDDCCILLFWILRSRSNVPKPSKQSTSARQRKRKRVLKRVTKLSMLQSNSCIQ